MVKKLSSIKVLDQTIKIEYKDMEDWGQCDIDDKTITLSNDCLKNKKLHFETLFHEVVHMILEMSGVAYMEKNDEEAYVRCIESLILPWIVKNKHLMG